MHPLIIGALALAALATRAPAEELTIVLDFEEAPNRQSVAEMKREFEGIMKRSALIFDYKTRAEAEQIASDNLVVVRFTGSCILKPVPYPLVERGPMAFSYSLDGRVQPFGEVACDRVVRAVRSAISAGDYAKADLLLGRALGRVLAHEVVHMLSRSTSHAREGVAYRELSGRQLISPGLRLLPDDLARIRLDR